MREITFCYCAVWFNLSICKVEGQEMKILLTNDDGYRALGINALFNALITAGHDVTIFAPELNSSGAGQSITVYNPISVTQASEKIYYVSSTPADSVRLGLQLIYGDFVNYPDLIISGINLGENVGEDVLYSGTVGAAREGLMHKISSFAVSTPGPNFEHMESAARITLDLVNRFATHEKELNAPFMWNINIPAKPYEQITGYEATKLGMRGAHKPMEEQITPRGRTVYWQSQQGDIEVAPIGTDLDVFLKQEKVSITPLDIYSTDYNQMPIIAALT